MASLLRNVLQLNSIKGNIIIATAVMGIFTLLAVGSSFWFSHALKTNERLSSQTLEPAKHTLESMNGGIYKAALALNAYLETGKEQHKNSWNSIWKEQIITKLDELTEKYSLTVDKGAAVQLKDLQRKTLALQEKQLEVINGLSHYYNASNAVDIDNGSSQHDFRTAFRHSMARLLNDIEDLEQALVLLEASLTNHLETAQQQQEQYSNLQQYLAFAILILCVCCGIAIASLLIKQINSSLQHIKSALNELSQGNIPEQIRQSRNETESITRAIFHLTHNLRNVEQFALKVGEGHFNHNIEVFNNSGALGASLASMRDSLARVAREDKQRNWINEGFARFGDILRTNNNSIAELCDESVSNIVKYVSANQGAIFLVEHSNEQGEEILKMTSCYAFDRKKYQHKEILKGEGLCGQAWQENDIILIDDVPQDYVNIRSGLGGTTPRAVLVVPLIAHEQTQGVLELASFSAFEDYQISFIKKIAENMASAIATARNHEKTQQLLGEFQQVTEQLRAQEEEMRQNMEELKATQEEMERAQREVVRKEYNLNGVINNTADTIFAIDRDYRITVVNKVLSDKYRNMGIALEVGTLISDVLPRSSWEIWKERYDRAMAGEQYSIVQESSGSKGAQFSQTYHNPIRDDAGNIVGVSVISRDVTASVVAQKEAERKRSTLNSLIDNTDDTYFAIDNEYRILIANKTLKDRFATSNITLNEGDYIFDKLPKEQHASWKERYDRALAGESFVLTTERQLKDKTLIIEVHHHPILDTAGKVIGASVVSKDITRWQQHLQEKEAHEKELNKLRQLIGLEDTAKAQVLQQASQRERSRKV